MLIIAHRGNLEGPNPDLENNPNQIDRVYSGYGLNSEIDLWKTNEGLFLGHDYPQYHIEDSWLHMRSNLLWIHCKNIEALCYMQNHAFSEDFNYFWHEEDAYTMTSKGYIWAYPGKRIPKPCRAIAVMPETIRMNNEDLKQFRGICTDYGISYL